MIKSGEGEAQPTQRHDTADQITALGSFSLPSVSIHRRSEKKEATVVEITRTNDSACEHSESPDRLVI